MFGVFYRHKPKTNYNAKDNMIIRGDTCELETKNISSLPSPPYFSLPSLSPPSPPTLSALPSPLPPSNPPPTLPPPLLFPPSPPSTKPLSLNPRPFPFLKPNRSFVVSAPSREFPTDLMLLKITPHKASHRIASLQPHRELRRRLNACHRVARCMYTRYCIKYPRV